MSMTKGQWHRVNGVLRRKYRPRRKTKVVSRASNTIHDAQIVADVTDKVAAEELYSLKQLNNDALVAILDNVWHGMSLEEKVALLDPRDPSNPEGAI
jgi:hypothetical protein